MLCLILVSLKIILGWKNFCFSELHFHIELFTKDFSDKNGFHIFYSDFSIIIKPLKQWLGFLHCSFRAL